MLSYRHAFHAGNFADVLKHSLLIQILDYLKQKEAPFHYIETHAGSGFYDLTSPEGQKLAEYQQGVGRLWLDTQLPKALNDYVAVVKQSVGEHLTAYPGSPWLAFQQSRAQDKVSLCELHPQDGEQLSQLFVKQRRVKVYLTDGWQKSLALTPPLERRGLIFMDPSYELKKDYVGVAEHLAKLVRKFSTGIYVIWYPIADPAYTQLLFKACVQSGVKRITRYEIGKTRAHEQPGMTGAGLLVVNAPWVLTDLMLPSMDYFAALLGDQAYADIEVLVDE